MATPVIMVHGAFCGGWTFDTFRRPFEAAGHAREHRQQRKQHYERRHDIPDARGQRVPQHLAAHDQLNDDRHRSDRSNRRRQVAPLHGE